MNINFYNTIVTTFIIQLILVINKNNVQGNPIGDNENPQLLSRIYNDESWNNQNEQEYRSRNAWIAEVGENNNRKDSIEECKGGKTCETTTMDMPIKREMFVSRGWGAGGMPFNVLYMKNPKSNKSLRSSSSIIAEPIRSQPVSQAQQQLINNGLNEATNFSGHSTGETVQRSNFQSSTTNAGNPAKGRNSNSMLVPSRRHYSILPQLFVSYGWGPIGK